MYCGSLTVEQHVMQDLHRCLHAISTKLHLTSYSFPSNFTYLQLPKAKDFRNKSSANLVRALAALRAFSALASVRVSSHRPLEPGN